MGMVYSASEVEVQTGDMLLIFIHLIHFEYGEVKTEVVFHHCDAV